VGAHAGHVIVVPNENVENIYGLDKELAGEVHETARRVAVALKRAYRCGGGVDPPAQRAAGEPGGVAPHLHVFPRYEGDDLYASPWRDTTADQRRPYAAALCEAPAAGT
jgi:histidine triad (HIT) family protein